MTRYIFIAADSHHLLLAGLPAHPKITYAAIHYGERRSPETTVTPMSHTLIAAAWTAWYMLAYVAIDRDVLRLSRDRGFNEQTL